MNRSAWWWPFGRRSEAEVHFASRMRAMKVAAQSPLLNVEAITSGQVPLTGTPIFLWGRAQPGPQGLLRSPITGRECLAWKIQETSRLIYPFRLFTVIFDLIMTADSPSAPNSGPGWRDQSRSERAPFVVAAPDGHTINVNPAPGDVEVLGMPFERQRRGGLRLYRETERIAPPGWFASAVGIAAATGPRTLVLNRVPDCGLNISFGPKPP